MTHGLLLVEDDEVFAQVMARALTQRGYAVAHAHNSGDALQLAERRDFDYAILDLNLGKETSLALIPPLRSKNPQMRILILTGYASIATAVSGTIGM